MYLTVRSAPRRSASFRAMTAQPGPTGHPLLQRCAGCGVDFDHDVAKCPDCGRRTALGKRRAIIVAVVVMVTVVILAALWAAVIVPAITETPR